MRGIYRDAADREAHRAAWRELVVPDLMYNETGPLMPLLDGRSEMTVVDVGANKGFWAKAFLRTFPGAVSRILMIDPSPENFHELSNRDDNMIFEGPDFDIVRPYHCALGSKPGMVTLYTNEDGSPLASLFPHDVDGANAMPVLPSLNHEIAVPMQELDEVLARHPDMQHVDVLKMDVEGSELEVLKGASGALGAGKIDVVTFEFGLHQVESRDFFRDFYQLLSEFGFRFHLVADGKLSPIPCYDYRYENFTTLFTFVAERVPSSSRSIVLRPDRLDAFAAKLQTLKRGLTANIDAINKMQAEIGAALERESPPGAKRLPKG